MPFPVSVRMEGEQEEKLLFYGHKFVTHTRILFKGRRRDKVEDLFEFRVYYKSFNVSSWFICLLFA